MTYSDRPDARRRLDAGINLGTMVIDERVFTLTKIDIGERRIWFRASAYFAEPTTFNVNGDRRIHGPDGQIVWSVPGSGDAELFTSDRDQYVHIDQDVDITEANGHAQ